MLRGMTRRSAASRSFLSRPRRALIPAAVGCAALLLIAGCGPAKSAAATAPSSASSAGSSISAYLTCLRQHGVDVPTARPTVRPTARPTGGFGAGSATMQKARQACASLRPAGGFGFGGGGFAAAFQAFRTCMASHGDPDHPANRAAYPARQSACQRGAPDRAVPERAEPEQSQGRCRREGLPVQAPDVPPAGGHPQRRLEHAQTPGSQAPVLPGYCPGL
jgi:hypothetical protein